MSWFRPWAPWTNDAGVISFTKLVITSLLVHILSHPQINVVLAIALLAAAFGKSTFESWLSRSQFSVQNITARDEKGGTEDSYRVGP